MLAEVRGPLRTNAARCTSNPAMDVPLGASKTQPPLVAEKGESSMAASTGLSANLAVRPPVLVH
jgi:hypothetical protein